MYNWGRLLSKNHLTAWKGEWDTEKNETHKTHIIFQQTFQTVFTMCFKAPNLGNMPLNQHTSFVKLKK